MLNFINKIFLMLNEEEKENTSEIDKIYEKIEKIYEELDEISDEKTKEKLDKLDKYLMHIPFLYKEKGFTDGFKSVAKLLSEALN